MPETRIDFRYTRPDVVSAQRVRFLRSKQLKVILIIWAISMLVLVAPLILPQWFSAYSYSSWGLVIQIGLVYAVTLFVLVFFTPFFDFYINRLWRLPLTLQFNSKRLRVTVTGKTGGLRLRWKQIEQVDESARAFVLHYGGSNKFLILPKAAFTNPADEHRFRELLAGRVLIREEPGDEEGLQEEN